MQRYFLEKDKFKDSDISHIKKVMRMKINDKIEIVRDNEVYLSEIVSLDPFEIKEIEKLNTKENNIKITIAQGILREQKWDLVIQKVTELGVDKIIPLDLKHCNVSFDSKKESKKYERWKNILKEASEQSYRSYIPEITDIKKLKDLKDLEYDLKLFCSTKEKDQTLKKVLQNNQKCGNILIVIGPEGGLSLDEEKYMMENDFISVTLGENILRTETAPIFVISAINYECWS